MAGNATAAQQPKIQAARRPATPRCRTCVGATATCCHQHRLNCKNHVRLSYTVRLSIHHITSLELQRFRLPSPRLRHAALSWTRQCCAAGQLTTRWPLSSSLATTEARRPNRWLRQSTTMTLGKGEGMVSICSGREEQHSHTRSNRTKPKMRCQGTGTAHCEGANVEACSVTPNWGCSDHKPSPLGGPARPQPTPHSHTHTKGCQDTPATAQWELQQADATHQLPSHTCMQSLAPSSGHRHGPPQHYWPTHMHTHIAHTTHSSKSCSHLLKHG